MLTVHHLAPSQSERIVWLCEELGVPYDLISYARDPVTRQAPPEYKALQPFGTAPTITDGGLTLGETGAIMEYVIAKYGSGRLAQSADHPNFADYLYWFHFANGSFVPAVMTDYTIQMLGAADSESTRALRSRGALAVKISEQRLGQASFFAGDDFTAADIMMVLPLKNQRDLSALPNIRGYLQRIGERPAYQRAMKKAEPVA